MFLSRVERLEARARRAFALKKYDATLGLLEQLLEEVGENPHTLAMLALCCHRTNRVGRALAFAERAIEVEPEHLTALRVMSSALAAQGRGEEACAFAQRGLDAISRELPSPAPEGWRGWVAGWRGLRLSKEEREWQEWARRLVLRGAAPRAGEGARTLHSPGGAA